MTISVSYEAHPGEFADAYREITRRGFGRILRWGFGLGIPSVETILILSDPAKRSSPTLLWQLLPWWVMFPGLFIGFSAALRYWAIKRLLSDDASQRGLQHRRLDNEGLHIESTGITARVSWSALRSAIETPGFFLLFQSRDCAYYLPKSAMTAESVAAARLLLKEQMHGRVRLRA